MSLPTSPEGVSTDVRRPAATHPTCAYEGEAYIAAAIRSTWEKSRSLTSAETPTAKGRDCTPPPSSWNTLSQYLEQLDEIARGRE